MLIYTTRIWPLSWFNLSWQQRTTKSCSLHPLLPEWDWENWKKKNSCLITETKKNIIKVLIILILLIIIIKRRRRGLKPKENNQPLPGDPLSSSTAQEALWWGMSLWVVWVSCPGRSPSQLLVLLLIGRAWKILDLGNQHQFVINSLLIFSPKCSTGPANEKKINSVPTNVLCAHEGRGTWWQRHWKTRSIKLSLYT